MSNSPPVADNLTAPYRDHLDQGVFAMPQCKACGRFHFYPRPSCPFCRSLLIAWAQASGRGSVYSFSVVHRAPAPAFESEVPYAVAIVRTDEGPHLMSRIVGIPAGDVRIGLRVRVRIRPSSEGVAAALFEPDEEPLSGDDHGG